MAHDGSIRKNCAHNHSPKGAGEETISQKQADREQLLQHSASHAAHDHGSHGSHHHAHHGPVANAGNAARVGWAAAVTGLFLVVEVVGGLLSGSLALLADAGHMLSDFGSLVLALVGFQIAQRPADSRRTYGFARVSVLAAFVNGLTLFALSAWILIEAVMRLQDPPPVAAPMMLWIAAAGLVANSIAFAILHGADRTNLNIRGALLHVAGDMLGSVAAIVAGVVIVTTGWTAADPILSALIALILLRSAWNLVMDSGHVLLEGAPAHIDVAAISADLAAHVKGVADIHHAHVWSLDGHAPMMTLHARIHENESGPGVVAGIKERLRTSHGVAHATIEIEHDDCAEPDCV